MSAPHAIKYFAIKTTVGQERNIARMLESRLLGLALKSGETIEGSVVFGGQVRCWQSFTPRNNINLKDILVFIGKEDGADKPVIASIHQMGEDGSLGPAVADALLDPLDIKGDGWHRLKLLQAVSLKRNTTYALTLSSESTGYRWFYTIKGDAAFEGEASVSEDGGESWVSKEFFFLIRLMEDVDVSSILILPSVKGYVFVEAASKETVATAIQNIRHVKNRPLIVVSLETIAPHLVETPLIETIDVGQMVEIVTGPLKGIVGRVIRVEKPRREVTLELKEAAFQLPISVSIDAIRPIESTSTTRK